MSTINQPLGDDRFSVVPHVLDTKVLREPHPLTIRRKDFRQQHLFLLRDVLSDEECRDLIAVARNIGFQPAGLATGDDGYRVKDKTRNNLRVMFEDTNLSDGLWKRVGTHVEQRFQNHVAVALNWRFRLYEYPPGTTFAPHVDNRTSLPGDRVTLFSLMIYLNESFTGGETTFFARRRRGQKNVTVERRIRPRTGMALVFDHLLFHEGSVVHSGVKYALRTDVIYQRK